MEDINFCPYCDASQHKIMNISRAYFCSECCRFFSLETVSMQCPKCARNNISKSDFAGAGGEAIFQCRACKHMFPASDLIKRGNT